MEAKNMTDETEIKDIKEFLDLEEKIKDYYSKHSTEVEIARKLSVLEAKVEQLVKKPDSRSRIRSNSRDWVYA